MMSKPYLQNIQTCNLDVIEEVLEEDELGGFER